MTADERIEYTNAVLCLQKKAPNTPAELAPGAKTRYDDWVAAHINQTNYIHFNVRCIILDTAFRKLTSRQAAFLTWHRWFTWEYEQALRNECGYTGAQPYWVITYSNATCKIHPTH